MTAESAERAVSRMTHLECAACGARADWRQLINTCPACGKMLLGRYDLEHAPLDRDTLRDREPTMWRYTELLPPMPGGPVSLGEMMTPLIPLPMLGRTLGMESLWLKDEGRLPTGTFKARGMAMAVTMAKALGANALAAPSAGNAGAALAAYALRAGLPAMVFFPPDVPPITIAEAHAAGAEMRECASLPDGGAKTREGAAAGKWFGLSTLLEPYRVEGKKTMGLELAEQLGWRLPDVIIYPTGGGTGLVGLWKAFEELRAAGWVSDAPPRMVAVQPVGCAPLVRAFEAGASECAAVEQPDTIAPGLRVPRSAGDFYLLRILRESKGTAIAVTDDDIRTAARDLAASEGLLVCPEGAATLAALRVLRENGWVKPDTEVVLLNTGTGLKHPELFT